MYGSNSGLVNVAEIETVWVTVLPPTVAAVKRAAAGPPQSSMMTVPDRVRDQAARIVLGRSRRGDNLVARAVVVSVSAAARTVQRSQWPV